MPNQRVKLLVCCTLILTLAGCATKEQTGTGLGAIVGGAAGYLFGGKYKKVATVLGAVAGGFIGNKLGKYLDERDKQRMEEVTKQTISTGKTHSWSNPEAKTSGKAELVATETKEEPVKVKVLKKKIAQVPPLDILGQTFRTLKSTDLRGGPGSDYEVVGKLAEGKAVNIVGKVKTSDWYLISEDGIGSGFIETSLLEPAPTEVPASSGRQIAETDVAEHEVSSNQICRKVEQSVSLADGSSHSETIEACQGPNGWEKA